MRRVVDQVGDGGNRLLDADAHNGINARASSFISGESKLFNASLLRTAQVEQHIVDAASGLLLVFREEHSQQIVQTTRTDSRAMLERD